MPICLQDSPRIHQVPSGLKLATDDDEDCCPTCLDPYSDGELPPPFRDARCQAIALTITQLTIRRGPLLTGALDVAENPKILTQCNHHFHLACIYEWLERSPSCPVCSRTMTFEELM